VYFETFVTAARWKARGGIRQIWREVLYDVLNKSMFRFLKSKTEIFPPKTDADLSLPATDADLKYQQFSILLWKGFFHAETNTNDDGVNKIRFIGDNVCKALKDLAAPGLRSVFLCHVRYVGMGMMGHVLTVMTPLDMVCILQHLIVRMLITGTGVAVQQ